MSGGPAIPTSLVWMTGCSSAHATCTGPSSGRPASAICAAVQPKSQVADRSSHPSHPPQSGISMSAIPAAAIFSSIAPPELGKSDPTVRRATINARYGQRAFMSEGYRWSSKPVHPPAARRLSRSCNRRVPSGGMARPRAARDPRSVTAPGTGSASRFRRLPNSCSSTPSSRPPVSVVRVVRLTIRPVLEPVALDVPHHAVRIEVHREHGAVDHPGRVVGVVLDGALHVVPGGVAQDAAGGRAAEHLLDGGGGVEPGRIRAMSAGGGT